MKEKFIKRYMDSINEYFRYTLSDDGKLVRYYIMGEYEKILHEEFDMSNEDTRNIYNSIYAGYYFKGKEN